jgi:hypothetical protein
MNARVIKSFFRRLLLNNKFVVKLLTRKFNREYARSSDYWETHYLNDGNSGSGSFGNRARYKAKIVNTFVAGHDIKTVMEFGCGDGNLLKLLHFPCYIGMDVSPAALKKCESIFKGDSTRNFFLYDRECFPGPARMPFEEAELALSLDVIFHLLEDDVFEDHMFRLFAAATRFVIIYAWNVEGKQNKHVKHRKFSSWVSRRIKGWKLLQKIENKGPGIADFFIYSKEAVNVN